MYDANANPQDKVVIEKGGMSFNVDRGEVFFTIKSDHTLPEKYQGEYTSVEEADKAIVQYVESYKAEVAKIQAMMKEMAAAPKPKKEKKVA